MGLLCVNRKATLRRSAALLLVPIIGYLGLWILGSALFLIYFRVFNVPMQSNDTWMISRVPAGLSIITVPICSFTSFGLATRMAFASMRTAPTEGERFAIGLISLIFTIGMDLATTVLIAKMNLLIFPVDLMYLLAWAVIIPAVLLGSRRATNHGRSTTT